jgi:hypothetical protein
MIIVDLNQVMISNLHMQLGFGGPAVPIEEAMFRHMVLNSLRSYKTKFGDQYGEMIIACDNKNYWRKQIFPYYKASRKKNREKSNIDWKTVYEYLNKMKQELKEYFPYRVIEVETAEADDIIATLCQDSFQSSPVLIISADKDFVQLQRLPYVEQYDPIRKKHITHDDPKAYLLEHIAKGDTGDGIPNVLSPDDCFVSGKRQKPMTQKRLEEVIRGDMNDEVARNYTRNLELIDLTKVPEDLKLKIMEQYIQEAGKGRGKLMNYFIANKLKNLFEHIGEF